MSKLNCNVIRDILPLYADEVVCEDTRELVAEHLNECESCRKELDSMQKKVVIPMQDNSAGAMQKFKHKWNFRQVLKGAAIMLAVVVLVIGGIMYSYIHGLPVRSDLVQIRTGFQCVTNLSDSDLDTPEEVALAEASIQCPTAEQQWIVDISTEQGRTRTRLEYDYTTNAEGEQVVTGMTIYVYKATFNLPDDQSSYIRTSFSIPEGVEITEETDFLVTIVCSDKKITYSMREEGLFAPPTEHSGIFCPWAN